jgi:hypothetical protein
VIVENGGYGKDAAAPIASLLVEKYLRDTIATDRLELEDEMTNKNTMPRYLVRKQFKADSARAAEYADETGDSSRWLKYQTPSFRYMMLDTSDNSKSPLLANLRKPAPYKSALAERLARIRAQAAAQQRAADTNQQPSQQPIQQSPSGDTIVRRRSPRTVKRDSVAAPNATPSSPNTPVPKDTTQQ